VKILPLVLLLSTAPVLAGQTHDAFPSDFTPLSCAPAKSCESFSMSSIASAAFRFYGLTLDQKWVTNNTDAISKALAAPCRRHASCLAIPGNMFWFCDDVLWRETRPLCQKLFPGDDMCRAFLETYLLGIEMHAKEHWQAAQECASKAPVTHTKPLEIWMEPASIPPDYHGKVIFFALDPDTRLPVLANITFEDQIVYAPANPAGLPAAFYPFDYNVKFKRVPNSDGHSDVIPALVTARATGYPPTTFRLAAEVPKLIVEMEPAAKKLRSGQNVVIVHARDATTGKPVEARVMLGEGVVGTTNLPITLVLKRGKRPEIWLTSLFDKYSDVVVAKPR
jgi:hypothetical protein